MSKVCILYYHRINDIQNDRHLLCVTPENFEQQLEFLKRNYNILRFEEDWSQTDRDSIVVTFDDGYMDNLTHALPILESEGVPATVFVSTGNMKKNCELWWDELETVLFMGENFPKELWLKDDIYGCRWDTATYKQKENCYKALHYMMKNWITVEKREAWLEQLWQWRGLGKKLEPTHLTLTKDTCNKLAMSKYITIGAHTVNHPALAKLSYEQQENEIAGSVRDLEELLGYEINMFSYPFGSLGNDFDKVTEGICKKLGIKKAAATTSGLWVSGMGYYDIPRNCIRDWGIYEFETKIREIFEEKTLNER